MFRVQRYPTPADKAHVFPAAAYILGYNCQACKCPVIHPDGSRTNYTCPECKTSLGWMGRHLFEKKDKRVDYHVARRTPQDD